MRGTKNGRIREQEGGDWRTLILCNIQNSLAKHVAVIELPTRAYGAEVVALRFE